MAGPLRVLILEDRWHDAVLMAAALEEAGYAADWRRVQTEEAFCDALASAPDVILADYQLPDYDALSAIRCVVESGRDIPVIVVTGALGDEAAAACITAGATDYILKDRLARLGTAVSNALQKRMLRAQSRDAQDAVVRSERRFRAVYQDSPVGIVILDPDGRIVEPNPAFCTLASRSGSEMHGLSFTELLDPADKPSFADAWAQLTEHGESRQRLELRIGHEPSRPAWASITLSLISDTASLDGFALMVLEDITARVEALEAKRRRDAIVQATGLAAERFLSTDDWHDALEAYLRLIGEAAGASAACIMQGSANATFAPYASWMPNLGHIEPELHEQLRRLIVDHSEALSARRPVHAALTTSASDATGRGRPMNVMILPVPVRQSWWGVLALAAEPGLREWHAEELTAYQYAADLLGDAILDRESSLALRASEERTRLLIDTSLDAVISTDRDGFIAGWNPQAERMFGYTSAEAEGNPILSMVAPANCHAAWRSGGVRPLTGKTGAVRRHRFETVGLRRTGDEFPVEVAVASAQLNDTPMLSLFVRDLTVRRLAEAALAEAKRQDEQIASRIQEALLIGDPALTTGWLQMAVDAQPGRVISGDFVLSLHHSDTVVDLVVGDVMGKGLTAALLGAITKNYLHEAVRQLVRHLSPFNRLPEPHEAVAAVHQHMSGELRAMESFVTLSYARLDREHALCTIVDCGHTRTVHYHHARSACTLIKGDNFPLGVAERELFTPVHERFEPGDLFLFYSDGVIEAESRDMEQFGEERVLATVMQYAEAGPSELVNRIKAAVSAFCGSKAPGDDLTLVAIGITEDTALRPSVTRTLEITGDTAELERVRTFAADVCAEYVPDTLSATEVDRLILAIHEAACNVIEHAHVGLPELGVQIIAEAFDDRIEFRIYDSGTGFSLRTVPEPELGSDRQQQLGVYFIKRGVDGCTYRRDHLGRNYLHLAKRLSTGSASAA